MHNKYIYSFKKNLLLHVIRSSNEIRYKLVFIAFICASTFGIIAGPYSAIDNLFKVVERSQNEGNLADLELITAPEDIKNLPNFELGKSDYVENRLLFKSTLAINNKNISALFISQNSYQSQKINRLIPISGSLPKDNDIEGVAIERNCANFYHKEVGDTLSLKVNQSPYLLTIKGIVQSPEYLMAPVNAGVYIPSSGSLCVIFGTKKLMEKQLGFEAFNSLLFKFDHPSKKSQSDMMNMASTRLSVDYSLTRNEQFNKKFLDQNLNVFKVFIPVIVSIFLITTSFSIYFLMRQWINRERPTISMMMILGYKRFDILIAYLIPLFFIILITTIFGCLFAWLDAWGFGVNYARAIEMPAPMTSLANNYLIFAAALTSSSIIIGMYFPLKLIFKISPLEALRENLTNDRTSVIFGKLAMIVKGPFWVKYPIRNLLRHWKFNLISIMAIGLTMATTICFNITTTSMQQTAYASFAKDNWQAVIDLDSSLWDDEAIKFEQAIPGSIWSTFVKGGVQVSSNDKIDNAFVIGIDINANVRKPKLLEGKELNKGPANGIVIERSLASKHQIKVGDALNLIVRNQTYETRVVGIHSSAMPNEIIMNRAFAAEILSLEDQFTGIFLISPSLDHEKLLKINNIPGVIGITTKNKVYSAIAELSKSIDVIVNISIIISVFISILFISSSTAFTLDAKANDYGVLRAIGYSKVVIAKTILMEILLIVAFAALIAIPISLFFASFLNEQLTEIWFKVTTISSTNDFISVILPTIALIPIAALPSLIHILNDSPVSFIRKRRSS